MYVRFINTGCLNNHGKNGKGVILREEVSWKYRIELLHTTLRSWENQIWKLIKRQFYRYQFPATSVQITSSGKRGLKWTNSIRRFLLTLACRITTCRLFTHIQSISQTRVILDKCRNSIFLRTKPFRRRILFYIFVLILNIGPFPSRKYYITWHIRHPV